MGIENLLNFIKPALIERCITYYRGKTAAVDAMSWLYRGCYSCAYELNQNIKTNDYLYFLQKMLMMLREYQITPILVFDGRKLRAKEKTEQIRKQLKAQNLQKGQELLTNGNQNEAKKYFQRCLKITKQMLYTTFDVLKEMEVQFIISPYEADAQMAYMCQSGQCDFAITEDSDLICYRCPLIVFKLQSDGSCFELELQKLRENKQNRQHIKNDDIRQFLAFNDEQLIDCCIMTGCDYVPSVRGIGIVKAINLINKYEDIGRVIIKMKQNKLLQDKIPQEYERVIRSTRLIFLFQTIYCSFSQKWQQLNQNKFDEFMQNIENEKLIPVNQINLLLGEKIQEELQQQFCNGNLDMKTLKPREIMKIDFVQLFKRFDKRIQNSQQVMVDIEVKQKVQSFLETTDLDNLPEFNEKPVQIIRDSQFLSTKKKQNDNQEIDIFQLCEDLFDQKEKEINVDDLEIIQEDKENEIQIQEIQQTQKKQQSQQSEDESASEQFNPFAHKSIVKNTQSLSQIQSRDLELSTQKKKTVEKIYKQSQSTMYSFVKKQ